MSTLKKFRFALSSYTDEREHKVGRFFQKLREHHSRILVRTKLMDLMQDNIAVINLWTEYRYKGYVYLKKSERKRLYKNLESIAKDFEAFKTTHRADDEQTRKKIAGISSAQPEITRVVLLATIMEYLSPRRGVYQYRASSSFGRLLRDPATETLIGDCNQIVTLYIYLYSRYFAVSDLKLRLLPEHVALHFQGIDIEATTGEFANYHNTKYAALQPIEEIVSINLLDITDEYFAKNDVSPKEFLQASRFAAVLSHDRDIVTKNLEVAYSRLVNAAMKRDDYKGSLTLAQQSRDMQLISIVGHNGALYFMKQHEFKTSRKFAHHALKRAELVRDSYRVEGKYLYDEHRYHEAIKAFERYGNRELVAKCYEALFFEEQNKLGNALTIESIQHHKSAIKTMHGYAKKSGSKQLIQHVDSLVKYL
jgi:hypothetical protein